MKWEYKATRLLDKFDRATGDGIRLTKALNEFGQDGWELMSVDLEQDCFIFKRSKIDQYMKSQEQEPQMSDKLIQAIKDSAGID